MGPIRGLRFASTSFARAARLLPVRYREQQPTFVPPMLLTSGGVSDGEAWTLELKWDGCRAQLRYDGRSVSLRTRHGRECSEDFPELSSIAGVLGKRRVTLDGELVCLRSDGRPDFARLRRRLSGRGRTPDPVMLQVFDVLHLDGGSTRALPYRERRALLEGLELDAPAWRTRQAWWSTGPKISSRASGNSAWKASSPSDLTRPTCRDAAYAGGSSTSFAARSNSRSPACDARAMADPTRYSSPAGSRMVHSLALDRSSSDFAPTSSTSSSAAWARYPLAAEAPSPGIRGRCR